MAARNATAQNAPHAKKVFTDEDMELQAGPLPRLKRDGAENADDVTAAIAKYKLTHTSQETEDVVHAWYDRYDSELAAAIQANLDNTSLRAANVNNGYELCQQNLKVTKITSPAGIGRWPNNAVHNPIGPKSAAIRMSWYRFNTAS